MVVPTKRGVSAFICKLAVSIVIFIECILFRDQTNLIAVFHLRSCVDGTQKLG
jgi:hypothetical protein